MPAAQTEAKSSVGRNSIQSRIPFRVPGRFPTTASLPGQNIIEGTSMLRQTLLTAFILSVFAASASAQLVAQPGVVVSPTPVYSVPQPPPYPMPAAGAQLTAIAPQTAVAVTNTYTQPAPTVTTQTQFYTPTYYYYYYYYYYYQPPQQVQYVQPVAPMIAAPMVSFGPVMSDFGVTPMNFGSFTNARGEIGHVRYPYYSYRRPWYYPGQPSFNVTIPGHIW